MIRFKAFVTLAGLAALPTLGNSFAGFSPLPAALEVPQSLKASAAQKSSEDFLNADIPGFWAHGFQDVDGSSYLFEFFFTSAGRYEGRSKMELADEGGAIAGTEEGNWVLSGDSVTLHPDSGKCFQDFGDGLEPCDDLSPAVVFLSLNEVDLKTLSFIDELGSYEAAYYSDPTAAWTLPEVPTHIAFRGGAARAQPSRPYLRISEGAGLGVATVVLPFQVYDALGKRGLGNRATGLSAHFLVPLTPAASRP